MSRQIHRMHPRSVGESPRKPLREVQKMEHYRVMQGPRIRKYFSTGDPVRDRQASGNQLKLLLVLGGIAAAMVLIHLVLRKF